MDGGQPTSLRAGNLGRIGFQHNPQIVHYGINCVVSVIDPFYLVRVSSEQRVKGESCWPPPTSPSYQPSTDGSLRSTGAGSAKSFQKLAPNSGVCAGSHHDVSSAPCCTVFFAPRSNQLASSSKPPARPARDPKDPKVALASAPLPSIGFSKAFMKMKTKFEMEWWIFSI